MSETRDARGAERETRLTGGWNNSPPLGKEKISLATQLVLPSDTRDDLISNLVQMARSVLHVKNKKTTFKDISDLAYGILFPKNQCCLRI